MLQQMRLFALTFSQLWIKHYEYWL
jgi:hypothetical protein